MICQMIFFRAFLMIRKININLKIINFVSEFIKKRIDYLS